MAAVLVSVTRWVRLQIRAAVWRQWKTPRRRRALIDLGVRLWLASSTAGSGLGPWYFAKAKALFVGLSNAYLKSLAFLPWSRSNGLTLEPPCTDPYARRCGRDQRATAAPMPIKSPYRRLYASEVLDLSLVLPGNAHVSPQRRTAKADVDRFARLSDCLFPIWAGLTDEDQSLPSCSQDVCDARHVCLYRPSHQPMAVQPYDLTVEKNQSQPRVTMTGLQKAGERERASPSVDQKPSHNGFPFNKIVYVGDLSGEASYGLRYAQKLAHEHHSELVLVHSLDPIVYALPAVELRDGAAQAELTAMEQDPNRHGANHDSFVQREQICAEILGEVRRHSASLLILSSEGRTAAGSMALATVARLLLADTPCSILTVPTPAKSAALPRWLWQNVIAATDFSDAGIAAVDLAQRIARRGLVVLHSTQCGKEQQCSHCMMRLRLLAPFNESHTLPVEHLVAPGVVTATIASVAQRIHPDLLVLGAPAVGVDSGHLDDSTVYRAIVESHCPVLLVPPGTGHAGGTIDKAIYAWLEKVRCTNGQPPLGISKSAEISHRERELHQQLNR
jgi:nucleotide-binding universal stress UspA family protein